VSAPPPPQRAGPDSGRLVLTSEFASVAVEIDWQANGPRLRIENQQNRRVSVSRPASSWRASPGSSREPRAFPRPRARPAGAATKEQRMTLMTDPAELITEDWRVHGSIYTDPEIFAVEKDRVFPRHLAVRRARERAARARRLQDHLRGHAAGDRHPGRRRRRDPRAASTAAGTAARWSARTRPATRTTSAARTTAGPTATAGEAPWDHVRRRVSGARP